MSSTKSNVHPGQYKVAGRERQGEDVVHERQRKSLAESQARQDRQAREDAPAPETEEDKED
jgi:hypothetical protein